MPVTREQIYEALFARLQAATWTVPNSLPPATPTAWLTCSRKVKIFADVPADQQPAAYQAEHDEVSVQVSRMPYKKTFSANWIIYHYVDMETPGAILNNAILDALYEVMKPGPTDPGGPDPRNTLGGFVYHAWIDGNIFKDPGDLDRQAMMVVPIKMLVP